MSATIASIDCGTLERFMQQVFIGLGVPAADAAVCAAVLIEADKRGLDSHGINRMKPTYYDRLRAGTLKPTTEFEIVRETATTAVIDGHFGMGHVIAKRAMALAITKAKTSGMGMTAVRHSTHYGIAGYYVTMATEQELIGFTTTNARPSIPPTFGIDNMLGTNPLTFGFPTDEEFPFVLDCATSITQRGKIEAYARIGKQVPAGLVTDRSGNYLSDPHRILQALVDGDAALLPVGGAGEDTGGYKGYGYAVVAEVLSAALQGGYFLKQVTGTNVGHCFFAIDVAAFTEPAVFRKATGDILRALRHSTKAPGADRIYTAGEKEYLVWQERKISGVPINPSVQQDIITMRDELGITGFDFPF